MMMMMMMMVMVMMMLMMMMMVMMMVMVMVMVMMMMMLMMMMMMMMMMYLAPPCLHYLNLQSGILILPKPRCREKRLLCRALNREAASLLHFDLGSLQVAVARCLNGVRGRVNTYGFYDP